MLVGEALFATLRESRHYLHWLVPASCALLVVVIGKWLALRKAVSAPVVDLVDESVSAGMGDQSPGSRNKS